MTQSPEPMLMKDGKPFEAVNELLCVIEAASGEEASAIFNLRMGFGAYHPMGESQECPRCGAWFYPSGSGQCWSCGHSQ